MLLVHKNVIIVLIVHGHTTYSAHRTTGPVLLGVMIPELPIGKKKSNLMSMILRKAQTYNHVI